MNDGAHRHCSLPARYARRVRLAATPRAPRQDADSRRQTMTAVADTWKHRTADVALVLGAGYLGLSAVGMSLFFLSI
jgi:hypothetical protein